VHFWSWFLNIYRCDWRLSFVNLKNETLSNTISNTDREEVWVPNLVFENNPEGAFIKNEPLSVLRVKAEGQMRDILTFSCKSLSITKEMRTRLFLKITLRWYLHVIWSFIIIHLTLNLLYDGNLNSLFVPLMEDRMLF